MTDRFDVIKFSDLSGPNGSSEFVRIGGGSFGVVYKGEYLGTQVAIKEVLPSTDYDVEKYFERECVLMKEARHPNIVQYIGLSKSPDGRIYIVSEFVGGNLRAFIADESRPFPWRLRVSFATDIARAMAYLHARNCLHRDLKGENLLITENERIKVCDFGFARIAARNQEEMRRMSYCGTDGYMAGEIILGLEFSLPADIFSLGVIFCEILSRHLVDEHTFRRTMPGFGLDADEVRDMASPDCPPHFIQLALDCCSEDPLLRPDMREVVRRLREIELEIIEYDEHEAAAASDDSSTVGKRFNVGSVRGRNWTTASKAAPVKADRPGGPPRIPSFEGSVHVPNSRDVSRDPNVAASAVAVVGDYEHGDVTGTEEEDREMDEAVAALAKLGIDEDAIERRAATLRATSTRRFIDVPDADLVRIQQGFGKAEKNPWMDDSDNASLPSIPSNWLAASVRRDASADTVRPFVGYPQDGDSEYSTSVVRMTKHQPLPSSTSSILTARPFRDASEGDLCSSFINPAASTITIRSSKGHEKDASDTHTIVSPAGHALDPSVHTVPEEPEEEGDNAATERRSPVQSFLTARSRSDVSLANATIASTVASASEFREPPALFHRFTLIKNGTRRPPSLAGMAGVLSSGHTASTHSEGGFSGSWLPPAIMFNHALARCHYCGKRIGWRPFLDCDDCPYKAHVKCGEFAPPNCQDISSLPTPGSRSTFFPSAGSRSNGNVSPLLSPSGSPPGSRDASPSRHGKGKERGKEKKEKSQKKGKHVKDGAALAGKQHIKP